MSGQSIGRFLRPLADRIRNLVARAAVRSANDAPRAQELELSVLRGETIKAAERLQEYGFTSTPLPPDSGGQAEAVAVFLGGGRDHPIVIATDDRRHRPRNGASGEVTLYDDRGARVHLGRSGLVIDDPDEVEIRAGNALLRMSSTEILLRIGGSEIELTPNGITITGAPVDFLTPAPAVWDDGGPDWDDSEDWDDWAR